MERDTDNLLDGLPANLREEVVRRPPTPPAVPVATRDVPAEPRHAEPADPRGPAAVTGSGGPVRVEAAEPAEASPAGPPMAKGPTGDAGEAGPAHPARALGGPRGAPAHIGRRPPSYPPRPTGLPSVHGSDLFAALVPDAVVDGAEYGRLSVRAASVRGDAHRWNKECRQDAAGVLLLGDEGEQLLFLAVADGVGSAPFSHRGSHGAVSLVASALDARAADLLRALRGGDEAALGETVGQAVAESALRLRRLMGEVPGSQYATTLRALLVPLDPAVRVRGFFAVGDGGLFRLRAGRWTQLDRPTPQDGGRGAGVIDTRTDALPDAFDRPLTRIEGPAEADDLLVLCTDGLSGPLEGDEEFRAHLAHQWGSGVPQPSDFLWQLQTRLKSYDDDRSAVCLWERSSG